MFVTHVSHPQRICHENYNTMEPGRLSKVAQCLRYSVGRLAYNQSEVLALEVLCVHGLVRVNDEMIAQILTSNHIAPW